VIGQSVLAVMVLGSFGGNGRTYLNNGKLFVGHPPAGRPSRWLGMIAVARCSPLPWMQARQSDRP